MNASPNDGICCANDYVALNIMRGLADFDQLARFTLDALIRRIDETHHADGTDRRPASRAIVGHRLITRESTGLTPC